MHTSPEAIYMSDKVTIYVCVQDAVFEVEQPRRTYRMLASSRQEANDWCQVILDVLGSPTNFVSVVSSADGMYACR
jgi:hypothetical protein